MSGSYADNTLSLMKQGGGSVDIPFEGLEAVQYILCSTNSGDWTYVFDRFQSGVLTGSGNYYSRGKLEQRLLVADGCVSYWYANTGQTIENDEEYYLAGSTFNFTRNSTAIIATNLPSSAQIRFKGLIENSSLPNNSEFIATNISAIGGATISAANGSSFRLWGADTHHFVYINEILEVIV